MQETYLLLSSIAIGLVGRLVYLYEIEERKGKKSSSMKRIFTSSITGGFMGAVGYLTGFSLYNNEKKEITLIFAALFGYKGVDAIDVVSKKVLGDPQSKKK